jgi:transposase InsO family protein
MSERMTSQLAVNAISNAISLRRPDATVVHSDRGSQFRSDAFVRTMPDAGLHGSMGRVGACADNAAMKSSSACCKRTSSTAGGGPPANSYASRS